MNKQIWIIANWKSNKTITEALEWLGIVGPKISPKNNVKIVVCPPFTDIPEIKKEIMVGNYPLLVGAQDLSPFEEGPFTGEEAGRELAQFIDLVILGHSERRQNFKETDEMVAEKTKRAGEYKIIPLVCVQDANTPVPEGVDLVAYEPIFATGTGNPDTPGNAEKMAVHFKKKYGENMQVLYGGSVTHENTKVFLQQPNINGLLIGKASLDAAEFLQIVEMAAHI